MRLRVRNAYRLERVAFVEGIRELDTVKPARALALDGLGELIGEIDAVQGAGGRQRRRQPDPGQEAAAMRGDIALRIRETCDRPGRGGEAGCSRGQAGYVREEFGGDLDYPDRVGERARLFGRNAVDDGQPRLDRGAVAREHAAGDGNAQHDAVALLQTFEGRAPRRALGREACARDGDEAASRSEVRQRRGEMPGSRAPERAIDPCQGREGRVHENDARPNSGVEVVVDLRGVVSGDGNAGEQAPEQVGTEFRELVEGEAPTGQLGEDGEKASPGRGSRTRSPGAIAAATAAA